MINNEQWKSGGQCSICKRKSYCKKQCKANKENFKTEVKNTFANKKQSLAMMQIMAILGGINYDK